VCVVVYDPFCPVSYQFVVSHIQRGNNRKAGYCTRHNHQTLSLKHQGNCDDRILSHTPTHTHTHTSTQRRRVDRKVTDTRVCSPCHHTLQCCCHHTLQCCCVVATIDCTRHLAPNSIHCHFHCFPQVLGCRISITRQEGSQYNTSALSSIEVGCECDR
jgi:hypothetical protein